MFSPSRESDPHVLVQGDEDPKLENMECTWVVGCRHIGVREHSGKVVRGVVTIEMFRAKVPQLTLETVIWGKGISTGRNC